MAFPLHNHTEYSGLDGLSRPQEIADRCKEVGFLGAACTDHGLVAGHIDFHQTMTEAGLKPVLGLEAYQAHASRRLEVKKDAYHFLLLAENDKGLRNLWALSTESHRSGFYFYPRTDWEILEQFHEGIIATSACTSSLLCESVLQEMGEAVPLDRRAGLPAEPLGDPYELIDRYLKIFGEGNFYIELHTYDQEHQALLNIELVKLAREKGLPLVYANDAHYAFPEQYELHEAAITIGTSKKLSDKNRMTHPKCLYIMDEDEVREKFVYLPQSAVDEAIRNSDEIAERCNVSIPERRFRVPVFVPEKPYKTAVEQFFELALDGYKRKITAYGKDEDVYWPRFEREIEIMIEAELVDYFLIVRDYIRWAKDNDIMVGPGRGSVGGSLVAYLLGITQVDPIRYGLIFERFYNPGRAGSLPDIDTDFDPDGRDRVKGYITKKYGEHYVADITTITRMQAKAAVRDLGRIMEIPFADSAKINDIIDSTTDAGISADWDEIWDEVGPELREWEERYPKLFEFAKRFYDYIRTYGVHASAIVIGDEPLDTSYPLRWAAKMKRLVSQWDMHVAEDLGYLKMDLLGLRNLSTLTEMNKILVERGKDSIEFEKLQYQEHPEEMWKMLEDGYTVGVFQIESGQTARQIARELAPRSVDDLAVLVAMNRPGPLRAERGYRLYMKNKKAGSFETLHPYLDDILADTWGVFVYQEQVIQFVQSIGYSMEEADEVRAIMGKKKVEKIGEEYERFLPRATEHMDRETADLIWRDMVNFSKYGFNKSHAVEYALITQMCLAGKYYAPHEFQLAGMRTVDREDKPIWINEAMRLGIEIEAPDINESGVFTELVGDTILYGLTDVKGMGKSHASWVVANRPYKDYDDFIAKTLEEGRKAALPNGSARTVVDVGRARKLALVGAFGEPFMIEDIEETYTHTFKNGNTRERKRTHEERHTLSKDERIIVEEELLGVALSDDTAQRFEEHKEWIEKECIPLDAVKKQPDGVVFQVAGIVRDVRKRKTKNNDPFAFVKIGVDSEEVEFPVWKELLSKREQILIPRTPVYCKLQKNAKGIHAVDVRVLD